MNQSGSKNMMGAAVTLMIDDALNNMLNKDGSMSVSYQKATGMIPRGNHSIFGDFPPTHMVGVRPKKVWIGQEQVRSQPEEQRPAQYVCHGSGRPAFRRIGWYISRRPAWTSKSRSDEQACDSQDGIPEVLRSR